MRISFLGLGSMGQGMARSLIHSGHEVIVYNRNRSAAEELGKAGAKIADSPAQAARQEIVITMLSDDNAVESIVLGPQGVAEGMQRDGLHISMSTISPDLSIRLSAAHKARGQQYVAAPVFGRPEAAATGQLFIVAAGAKAALAKAKPVLELLGQRTFEADELPEHANLIKLLGNFMITCVLESLGEVFAVARKSGIDRNTMLDVLTGTLYGDHVYKSYGPRIIEEKFSPAGFKLPLGLKDVRLLLQAADKLSAPMPFANTIHDRFLSAVANGYGDLDWSALTLMIGQDAGFAPKAEEVHSGAAD